MLAVGLAPLTTVLSITFGMMRVPFLPCQIASCNARFLLRAKAYPSVLQAARFGRETKASKQVLLSQEANAYVMCPSLQ